MDSVKLRAWLTLPGDTLPWPEDRLPNLLPLGLRPDRGWGLALLVGAVVTFWRRSDTRPLPLFELLVCRLVPATFWPFFLWAGVCLLADLVVAGMADDNQGNGFYSQHGSQIRIKILSKIYLYFIDLVLEAGGAWPMKTNMKRLPGWWKHKETSKSQASFNFMFSNLCLIHTSQSWKCHKRTEQKSFKRIADCEQKRKKAIIKCNWLQINFPSVCIFHSIVKHLSYMFWSKWLIPCITTLAIMSLVTKWIKHLSLGTTEFGCLNPLRIAEGVECQKYGENNQIQTCH